MGPVSASITIDTPREAVLDLLTDLAVRPAIVDHFVDEFRLQRLESSGVGAAARFRIPDRNLWLETVIAEVDAPYRVVERGRGGRLDRIPISTVWELVEGPSPETTRVTVTFVAEPRSRLHRVGGTERWYRRQWKRALGRLRDLAESAEAPPRIEVAGADRIPS